jgi:endonuclease/exonuclease/phosphatase family metal-dependent hydrolase
MKLGTRTAATFPGNGRHIDYVWVDRKAYADGRIRFAGQATIGRLHSDHNSLLARLTLS